jgi:ubiquinol-cytochrome c reductase iron-sulfur subunit
VSDKNLPVKPEDEHGAVEVAEPIPDPGLEPHEPRITDIDPKAADRVERQVSGMFGLATLLVVGSCVAYFAIPRDSILEFGPLSGNANNMVIGLCIGLALFLIGAGAIQWAKKLMVDEEISEERHPAHSSPQQIAEITEAFKEGTVESGFGRRKMIRNSARSASSACRPSSCSATSARCRAGRCTTRSGRRASGSSTTSPTARSSRPT